MYTCHCMESQCTCKSALLHALEYSSQSYMLELNYSHLTVVLMRTCFIYNNFQAFVLLPNVCLLTICTKPYSIRYCVCLLGTLISYTSFHKMLAFDMCLYVSDNFVSLLIRWVLLSRRHRMIWATVYSSQKKVFNDSWYIMYNCLMYVRCVFVYFKTPFLSHINWDVEQPCT